MLPTPVLDSLAKDGKVRADTRATFGTVDISAVVKKAHRDQIFRARKSFAMRCWLPTPLFMPHRERRRVALTWAR